MKSHRFLICTFATATAAHTVQAADFTGSLATGYNSIYEFRGVDLGSDMVEASASLSTMVNGFGITASAWYAAVNDNPNNTTPDELDLTLGLTKTLGPVNLSAGYIYYDFINASSTNTQELYLGAAMEIGAGITASVTAYRDVDLFDAWYVDANLSRTFAVSDCVKIVATLGAGYADGHGWQLQANGGTLDGYQQFYAMVSVPWTVRERVTLAPYLKYVNADGDLVADVPGGGTGQDHLICGLKLTVEF